MKRMLQNLKKKPERTREQIALIAAGCITILIIVVWIFSLQHRFSSSDSANTAGEKSAPEKPLQLLFRSISDTLKPSQGNQEQQSDPFGYDESNAYDSSLGSVPEIISVTNEGESESVHTTTNTGPSKDQIEGEI